MALNDIKVPKENASGTFDEITLPDATTSARGLLTSADKTKLDGIASGAEVNVNADWNASSGDAQILNKPTSLTPNAHAASHAAAGSDPVTLDVSQVASVNGFGNVWGGGESLADVFANAGDMFYANQSDFAAASHTHGNLTNDGKVGSDSGRVLVTTTAGAVTTLALGTAGQVLQVNSGATGVEFAAASGGGVASVMQSIAVGFVLH
jgi:hypothetical protein